MTAGETAQVRANMSVVHNILNGSGLSTKTEAVVGERMLEMAA